VCSTYANALPTNKTVLTATWSQTSSFTITYGTPYVSVSARACTALSNGPTTPTSDDKSAFSIDGIINRRGKP